MKAHKSWRRLLMLVAALPLAGTMAAAHPSGNPAPKQSASVTLAQTSVTQSGCDLTLTYTWRGFRNVWRYGVSIYQYTPESNTAPWVATYGARASGSGTATLVYTMEPGSAARFYGKGTLWTEADNLIAGSYQTTPDLNFSCPAAVSGGAARG